MKKNCYICRALFVAICMLPTFQFRMHGQTPGTNHVVVTANFDVLNPMPNLVKFVQYYDGMGRPVQSASTGVNQDGAYVHNAVNYDSCGRQDRIWLPIVGGGSPDLLDDAQVASLSSSTYGERTAFCHSEYGEFGSSVKTYGPGARWTSKPALEEAILNVANSVKKYAYSIVHNFPNNQPPREPSVITPNPNSNSSGDGLPHNFTFTGTKVLSLLGYYGEGELTGTRHTDEDGHVVESYRDLEGNVILERRNGNNDTYYVYDRGLLMYVLPPLYQSTSDTTLLYKYKYDDKGRCVEKVLPGNVKTRFWYDRYGRVSFSQDPRLLKKSRYRFYLYDELGRLAVQGTCTNVIECSHEANVSLNVPLGGPCGSGYTGTGWDQLENPELEAVNYYDGYRFIDAPAFSFNVRNQLRKTNPHCATTFLTGQLLSTTDGEFLFKAMYYDNMGNIVDSREASTSGSSVQHSMIHSATGKLKRASTVVSHNGITQKSVTKSLQYNAATDQLDNITLQVDSASPVTICQNTYDDLGRLVCCSANNNSFGVSYRYNSHGWLTSIAAKKMRNGQVSLFDEKLHYADGSGTPCYNGNISSLQYKFGGDSPDLEQPVYRGYKFSYDRLNRLTSATYCVGESLDELDDSYSESAYYNANSSITSLTRMGKRNHGMGVIDKLIYTYTGNKLKAVSDSAENLTYAGSYDFKNGVNSTTEYVYDGCGALKYDRNKKIIFIDYDFNGLPTWIQFSNGSYIENVYSSDGVKLKTIHTTAVSGLNFMLYGFKFALTPAQILHTDTTLFVGGFEITQNNAYRYQFETGYLDIAASGNTTYHYYVKDHLSSVRLLVDENCNVEQVNNYFPYGGLLNDVEMDTDVQDRKFGGKQLDRMHGLNLYDFHARQYDAALGLFTSMDPLCETTYHMSPYVFCMGNPVNMIDPSGLTAYFTNNKSEIDKFLAYMRGNTSDAVYTYSFSNWDSMSDQEFLSRFSGGSSGSEVYSYLVSHVTCLPGTYDATITVTQYKIVFAPEALISSATPSSNSFYQINLNSLWNHLSNSSSAVGSFFCDYDARALSDGTIRFRGAGKKHTYRGGGRNHITSTSLRNTGKIMTRSQGVYYGIELYNAIISDNRSVGENTMTTFMNICGSEMTSKLGSIILTRGIGYCCGLAGSTLGPVGTFAASYVGGVAGDFIWDMIYN